MNEPLLTQQEREAAWRRRMGADVPMPSGLLGGEALTRLLDELSCHEGLPEVAEVLRAHIAALEP
jgi:hypothetical protein